MATAEVMEQERNYLSAIRNYYGPDPLQPRFEYIIWLKNVNKTNLHSLTEDTVSIFVNDPRYVQDPRLVKLILILGNGGNDENRIEWANKLLDWGHMKEAQKLLETGLHNNKQSQILYNAYMEFLVKLGKTLLKMDMCSRCLTQFKNINKGCNANAAYSIVDDPDEDFDCPVAIFETYDPCKVPCYAKNMVYQGKTEYQFEELRAQRYFLKLENKKIQDGIMGDQNSLKLPKKVSENIPRTPLSSLPPCPLPSFPAKSAPLQAQAPPCSPRTSPAPHPPPFQPHSSTDLPPKPSASPPCLPYQIPISSPSQPLNLPSNPSPPLLFPPQTPQPPVSLSPPLPSLPQSVSPSCCPFQQSFVPISEPPPPCPTKPLIQKGPLISAPRPLFPQLCQDTSAVNCQSFTVNTKEAMHMVQEMWHSPPPVAYGKSPAFKIPKDPPPSLTVKKQPPFQVFSDFDDPPPPQPTQPKNEPVIEQVHREETSKRKLDKINITRLINTAQEAINQDFCDDTCNTGVFNIDIGFPTSTPCYLKSRREQLQSEDDQNCNGSYISNDCLPKTNSKQAQQGVTEPNARENLSMILEASVEKYSSSSGSIPGVPASANKVQPTNHADLIKGMEALKISENPFNAKLLEVLLALVEFPRAHHREGYYMINTNIPNFGKTVKLGGEGYAIQGELGRGNYARVLKATCGNKMVALKVEKPACIWEFYIVREIQQRLPPEKAKMFMATEQAFIFNNGSVLKTDWAVYGTLLDVVNQAKKSNLKLETCLTLVFSIQLIDIVEFLHGCGIIHADIKPDNFVVRALQDEPWIQLIDFGRCIDMTLLPPGIKFTCAVETDGFVCNEVKENKPWTYQIDLYGLAGTIYCILVNDYMKVTKDRGSWILQKILPRNRKRELWDCIFHSLLNVESCENLPDLSKMRTKIATELKTFNPFLIQHSLKSLCNNLMGK